MFSKIETIELLISELDESVKEMMRNKIANLSKEKFNKMANQAGLKELRIGYYTFL